MREFDTLVDMLIRMGFEWRIYIDEDEEPSRELYAEGSVNGIVIKIHCKPKECEVYAPEYRRAVSSCYSKPSPTIVKCIDAVVEEVKELMEKAAKLAELADMLREMFNVSQEYNGIYAFKGLKDGLIEVTVSADGESELKLWIRTKTPIKTIIAATELAKLAEQLKL